MNTVTFSESQNVDKVGFRLRLKGCDVRDCIAVMTSNGLVPGILSRNDGRKEPVVPHEVRGIPIALDIGKSRIDAHGEKTGSNGYWGMQDKKGWNKNSIPYKTESFQKEGSEQGRFPANLILMHDPECACEGTKRVKGTKGVNNPGEGGQFGTQVAQKLVLGGYGEETVDNWICTSSCPVGKLDSQSVPSL